MEPELKIKAHKFFKKINKDGYLNRLLDKYYGHIQRLGQDDVKKFLKNTCKLLPDLRSYFYEAEEETNNRLAFDSCSGLSRISLGSDGHFINKCKRHNDAD